MPIAGIVASQITSNQVTQPLLLFSLSSTYWKAQITNKDATSANLYENANISPPTTNRGLTAYNGIATGDTIQKRMGGTFYAQAKISGRTDSNIVSLTMDPAL